VESSGKIEREIPNEKDEIYRNTNRQYFERV